eukprot:gene20093-7166_t
MEDIQDAQSPQRRSRFFGKVTGFCGEVRAAPMPVGLPDTPYEKLQ